jgi:multiple sugar transport system substrate-binding protein
VRSMQWKSRLSGTDFPPSVKSPSPPPLNLSRPVRPVPRVLTTRFLPFLAAAVLPVAVAGCPKPPAPTTPAPKATVLRVACPDATSATIVGRYGGRWASKAGTRLQVTRYDPGTGPAAAGEADVWVLPTARMPRWAADDALLPVPDRYQDKAEAYAWTALLPLHRQRLLVWEEKPYALPLLGDAWLCYWRADLFRQHGAAFQQKHGRELTPPATWQEYAEIAAFFHELGKPSLPPLPQDDDALEHEFYAVAVPFVRRAVREDEKFPATDELFSFHFDLESGRPRVNTPGFVAALQLVQRVQAYRPKTAAAEPAAAFEKGDAVLCLASPAWAARFQKGAVAGKFGVGRLPGSRQVFAYDGSALPAAGGNHVPYLGAGGWLGAVPRSAAEAEAAFALLAYLSGPEQSLEIVAEPAWGGGVFRREQFNKAGWQAFGLDTRRQNALVEALQQTLVHPGVINPVVRLRVPDERAYQQALVRYVREALEKGVPAEAALNAAAAVWVKIGEARGTRRRLNEYRLSVGRQALRE